jgi:chromosome segregation ATPase
MRVSPCTLAFLVAFLVPLSTPVFAQQPAASEDATACATQLAVIEEEIGDARARGRMLLRRELDKQLADLQARCNAGPAQASRAASIERLEQEVEALRAQLERAEEQLRRLRNRSP